MICQTSLQDLHRYNLRTKSETFSNSPSLYFLRSMPVTLLDRHKQVQG